MVSRCGSDPVVCYDYDKLIECMIDPKSAHEDWNAAYEEALEWVEYNVAGAYVGEHTPFILHAYCPPPGYKVQDDD